MERVSGGCVVCGLPTNHFIEEAGSWVHAKNCAEILRRQMDKEEDEENRIWAFLEREHPCPRCGAAPGQRCRTPTGGRVRENHKGRGR